MIIYRVIRITESFHWIDWLEDSRKEFGIFSNPEIAIKRIKESNKGRKKLSEGPDFLQYSGGKDKTIKFRIDQQEIE